MNSTTIKSLNAIVSGKLNSNLGKTLMTTETYPLYYRMITKCGCTFIMNILYYLNYGYVNLDPFAVHDKSHIIPKATLATNEAIANSPYSFVVIRDPVARFMSLYFDKLYGQSRPSEKFSLGTYFIENGLIKPNADNNVTLHRENCISSIKWIKKNLSGQTDQEVNWHWKPQKFRLNQVYQLHFNVLMLEDITFQLTNTLKPLVPHIEDVIRNVSAQNISKKPVQTEDVLNDELYELITNAYPDDMRIHREVSKYWNDLKEAKQWPENQTNVM